MKKDFELNNGISLEKFMNIREDIIKNKPQKLI